MKRVTIAVIIALSLMLGLSACGSSSGSGISLTPGKTTPPISVLSEICVFDANEETYLRTEGRQADLSKLGENEYYTFALILKNNTDAAVDFPNATVSVDGNPPWGWGAFTLQPNMSTRLHIYHVNMENCSTKGEHSVIWQLNDTLTHSDTLTLTDGTYVEQSTFWNSVYEMPPEYEIHAYTNPTNSRSPYIAGWLDISEKTKFTEYSVDFKSDFLPKGTYCCTAQWKMDLTGLKKQYKNVHTDYEQVHAYAGFQNTATEKDRASILSFWDIYATTANGTPVTIRAELLYPETTDNNSFGGEGTGAHCIVPYDWKESHWYRMLLQCSKSESTGTTLVTQWVCDLETGVWTKLCCYDTKLPDSCFTGPVAIFLENYIPDLAGDVRSMELRNIRYKNASDGKWKNVEKSWLAPNGGLPAYSGSYSYGANSDRFWMITSGVGGDWYGNGHGQKGANYSIKNIETGSPY